MSTAVKSIGLAERPSLSEVRTQNAQFAEEVDKLHEKLRLAYAGMSQFAGASQGIETTSVRAGSGIEGLSASMGKIAGRANAMLEVANTAAAVGEALHSSSVQAENLRTRLDLATGGKGAQEMAYVTALADRLGLQLGATGQAYADFVTKARGTALEGAQVQTIFSGIATASAAMGLSSEQAKTSLSAVLELMGRGAISASDFSEKLGYIPNAALIGAQALGVTQERFTQMLGAGEVVAQDFLPRFAQALQSSLGDGVDRAANRLDAGTHRMGNAWDKLKTAIGDSGISQAISMGMNAAANDMNAFSESMTRARDNGSGFLAQIGSGLGTLAGRAVGLNYLSMGFQSNAEKAAFLARELPRARAELEALQAKGAATSRNVWVRSAHDDAQRLVEKLQQAQRELMAMQGQRNAGGGRGFINPPLAGQGSTGSKATESPSQKKETPASRGVNYVVPRAPVQPSQDSENSKREQEEKKRAQELAQLLKDQQSRAQIAERNLELAQRETEAIGLSGEALGKLHQQQIEKTVADIEARATQEEGIRCSKEMAEAVGREAEATRQLAVVKDYKESARVVSEYAKSVKEASEALQFEQSLAGMSQRDRTTALEQRKQQIELEARLADIKAKNSLDPQRAESLQKVVTAAAGQAKENAEERTRLEQARKAFDQMDEMFRKGFADTLLNGTDAWRAFTKSLGATFKTAVTDELRKGLDELYNLVARPIVMPVLANIQGAISGVGGVLASGGASAAGVASLAGTVSAAWNLVSSGFNVAAAVGKGLAGSELLKKYGSESVRKLVGDFGAGMQSTASWSGFSGAFQAGGLQLAGAIAGSVLNGFSGYGLSKALSGGYSAGGWVNTAAGVASMIPGIGPIAGVIGGLVNRAFGRKLKDQGLEGIFGGQAAFTGNTYQFYKGGWFRSDKTQRGELDESTRNGLAEQFNAMRLSTGAMAQVLGLGSAAVDGFTASIKVSFNGLDEAAVQKRLGEEFDKVAEALAAATLGTTAYTRAGETSVQAIARLSGSLSTVNGVLGNLNSTLYASSLAGADMAVSLVELFGSEDGFKAATGSFFKNFYSAQEQRDAAQRELTRQLEAVNLRLPDVDADNARAQWRALADAQNLSTEEGRKAWSVLIKLSDAFAGLTQSAQDAAKATEQLPVPEDAAKAAAELRSRLISLEGEFKGGGLSRTYQAQDAARTVSGLLDSVGLGQDMDVLVGKILGATTGEVEQYFREMWALLDTTQARQQLVEVTGALMGLAKASSTLAETTAGAARGFAESAKAALAARSSAGGLIDRINGELGGDRVAYARQREQLLWSGMATASYEQQIELAGQLTDSVLSRMQLEKQSAEKLSGLHQGLRDSIEATRIGSLSPLTLGQQLKEAGDQFSAAVQKARAGDTQAAGEVAGLRQSYLQLAQRYYAASDGYAAIFQASEDAVSGLAGQLQSEARQQLAASQGTVSELQRLRDLAQAAYEQADRDYATSSTALKDQAALLAGMDGGIALVGDILKELPVELAAQLQPLLGGSISDDALVAAMRGAQDARPELMVRDLLQLGMQSGASASRAAWASQRLYSDADVAVLLQAGRRNYPTWSLDQLASLGLSQYGITREQFDRVAGGGLSAPMQIPPTGAHAPIAAPAAAEFGSLGRGVESMVSELKSVRTELSQARSENAQLMAMLAEVMQATGNGTAQQLRQAVREVALAGVTAR